VAQSVDDDTCWARYSNPGLARRTSPDTWPKSQSVESALSSRLGVALPSRAKHQFCSFTFSRYRAARLGATPQSTRGLGHSVTGSPTSCRQPHAGEIAATTQACTRCHVVHAPAVGPLRTISPALIFLTRYRTPRMREIADVGGRLGRGGREGGGQKCKSVKV